MLNSRQMGLKHSFSIELRSMKHLKGLTMSARDHETFLLEGFLGELESICFVEGIMLKIEATHGTISIEITEDELSGYRELGEEGMKGENRK